MVIRIALLILCASTGTLSQYCPASATLTDVVGGLALGCEASDGIFCPQFCCVNGTYNCIASTPIASCAGTLGSNWRQLQAALYPAITGATNDATFCSLLQQGLSNVPTSNPCYAYGQKYLQGFSCTGTSVGPPAAAPATQSLPTPTSATAATASSSGTAVAPAAAVATSTLLLTRNFTGAASIFYPSTTYSVQAPVVICVQQSLPEAFTQSSICLNVTDAEASLAQAMSSPAPAPALNSG